MVGRKHGRGPHRARMRAAALLSAGALMALGAAGCGSSDDGGGSSGGDAGSGASLTMWTFKQSNVPGLEAVAAAWGRRTGNTLRVQVYTPDDAYATKVRAAANTRDLPDIVSAHSASEEWQFAAAGVLDDITDEFDRAWQDELYPSAVSATSLTEERITASAANSSTSLEGLEPGHFYAVPYLSGSAGFVFARKSALRRAGVDLSRPPATFQAMVAAIERTRTRLGDRGGIATGLKIPPTGYYWLFRPLSFDSLGRADFLDRQGRDPTVSWSSPKSVETLELYDRLTPLWVPGVLALGIDEADQKFADGSATWDVGGTYTLSFLLDQGMDLDDVMVFPVPPPEGGAYDQTKLAPAPLVSAGVASTSEHRAEAIDFLRFLSSREGARLFGEGANDIPATDLGDATADWNPALREMFAALSPPGEDVLDVNDFSADPGAGAGPVTPGTADVLNKLVAGKSTPQQVGDELADMYAKAWAAQK